MCHPEATAYENLIKWLDQTGAEYDTDCTPNIQWISVKSTENPVITIARFVFDLHGKLIKVRC